jgi:hypothetical protein
MSVLPCVRVFHFPSPNTFKPVLSATMSTALRLWTTSSGAQLGGPLSRRRVIRNNYLGCDRLDERPAQAFCLVIGQLEQLTNQPQALDGHAQRTLPLVMLVNGQDVLAEPDLVFPGGIKAPLLQCVILYVNFRCAAMNNLRKTDARVSIPRLVHRERQLVRVPFEFYTQARILYPK